MERMIPMRICIISDLHANLEALAALPSDYDELWVLGQPGRLWSRSG